jgi:hypothetical protein
VLQLPHPLPLGQSTQEPRGQVLVQPRTRLNSQVVRQPNAVGNISPKIFPSGFARVCSRYSTSAARVSGKPESASACSKPCRNRCVCVCSCWRRSRYFRRGHCLALLASLGSAHAGHGLLLSLRVVCVEQTMAHSVCHFNNFHRVPR